MVTGHSECRSKSGEGYANYPILTVTYVAPRTWRVVTQGRKFVYDTDKRRFVELQVLDEKFQPILDEAVWVVDDETRQVFPSNASAKSVDDFCADR